MNSGTNGIVWVSHSVGGRGDAIKEQMIDTSEDGSTRGRHGVGEIGFWSVG